LAADDHAWDVVEFLIREYPHVNVNATPIFPIEWANDKEQINVNCAWFAAQQQNWALLRFIIETHPEIDLRVREIEGVSTLEMIIDNRQAVLLEIALPEIASIIKQIQTLFFGAHDDIAYIVARQMLRNFDEAFLEADEPTLDALIQYWVFNKSDSEYYRLEREPFIHACRIIASTVTLALVPIEQRTRGSFLRSVTPNEIRRTHAMIMEQIERVWEDRDESLYPVLDFNLRERIIAELTALPVNDFIALRVYIAIRRVIPKKKQSAAVKRTHDDIEPGEGSDDNSDNDEPPTKRGRTEPQSAPDSNDVEMKDVPVDQNDRDNPHNATQFGPTGTLNIDATSVLSDFPIRAFLSSSSKSGS